MGDLENCPQPAPSVTGSGENPGQGAALRSCCTLFAFGFGRRGSQEGLYFCLSGQAFHPPGRLVVLQ